MTPRIRSKTSSGTASTLRMRRSTMLAVSENDSAAGRSLDSTATPSESTCETMVRLTCTAWFGPARRSHPNTEVHSSAAVLAQQNGGAVGRRHLENRFQHLFFQRLQARAPSSPLC